MQRKILRILCLILTVCFFAFTFSACKDEESDAGGHEHKYNQAVVEEKYLKSEATCLSAAIYYYSCTCGEKGSKVFYDGRESDHVYDRQIEREEFLATPLTCTDHATYYYSCVCGEFCEETFVGEEEPMCIYNEIGECIFCGDTAD